MKIAFRAGIIPALLLSASLLSGCGSLTDMSIPAVNEETITEAAETLGISVENFEAFLENMGSNYDAYVETLNKNNQSFKDLKTAIEDAYDCTFKEYADAVIMMNSIDAPDETKYAIFKSELSTFDAYFDKNELDDNLLVNYDVSIDVADEAKDAMMFDMLQLYGGNISTYLDFIRDQYGCDTVEFTSATLLGRYGVQKPAESNKCMDKLFTYDQNTNEVLEKLTLPVATLHFKDESKNVTFALSDELGLIFKATGADSKDKMLKLSNLSVQIRKHN